VGELEGVEAKFEDFIDHFLAVGVTGVVPAGGEGEHGLGYRVIWELVDSAERRVLSVAGVPRASLGSFSRCK
jgi:hypothetical protein